MKSMIKSRLHRAPAFVVLCLTFRIGSSFHIDHRNRLGSLIEPRQTSPVVFYSQSSVASTTDTSSSSPQRPTDDESAYGKLTIEQASQILADWDRHTNPENVVQSTLLPPSFDPVSSRSRLPAAVRRLHMAADEERARDSTQGRCMLGICAASAQEGVLALKSWVTALGLPRGLLHGMDKDGVPLEIDSAVYIKYNTGGVLTFADIRKTGMGFDALWKPGDALLEPYDGRYRGVYFQVELEDEEFRQYLVPLDLFGPI